MHLCVYPHRTRATNPPHHHSAIIQVGNKPYISTTSSFQDNTPGIIMISFISLIFTIVQYEFKLKLSQRRKINPKDKTRNVVTN